MQYERKIISIFKSFIEKALLPQIKKMQGSLYEWNKFNAIISTETINYNQLQTYVDSLGGPVATLESPERKDQFSYFKKRNGDGQNQAQNQSIGFNPSKTFGGSRARMVFPLKNQTDDMDQRGNTSINNQNNQKQDYRKINPQLLLPGLERLTRMLFQNQQKLQQQMELNSTGRFERKVSY